MRTKMALSSAIAVLAAASLSAHVMVSPTTSKAGATQKYEVRVHNEAKVAAKSIEVEIPEGMTVTDIATSAVSTSKKAGDRITSITWTVDVQPTKYVALTFTAKNPDAAKDLRWTVHEHLADGTVVDWSDKPGSKEKGSITKLTAGQ